MLSSMKMKVSGLQYKAERTESRKMSIIEELYNGQVCPVEDIQPKNKRYRSLTNEIGDEREYFASKLLEDDKERFNKWNELVFKYEGMFEYTNFEYGFRLGSILTLATFSEERDHKEIGEVAYRMGFCDGIQFSSEIKRIK